jgi:hypothetical protein
MEAQAKGMGKSLVLGSANINGTQRLVFHLLYVLFLHLTHLLYQADENAPEKPPSAYVMFANSEIPQ